MDTRINPTDKQNDPLYKMVNSIPTHIAPVDFSTRVMEKINALDKVKKINVFKIPIYIKFGIPAILTLCLVVLFIQAGPLKVPNLNLGIDRWNDWLKGLKIDGSEWMQNLIPTLEIPDNLVLIVGIGIVLCWGFFFQYRFLSRWFDYRLEGV